MAVTSEDFQSTPLTPRAGTSVAHVARPAQPGVAAEPEQGPAPPDPNRVGIVFVHGIGSQKQSETFLDWSSPIVNVLSAWRLENGLGIDPVRRAEFSFSGASSPYLEIPIPAVGEHPAQSWVITEAWWATQVRPPAVGAMTSYLLQGLPRIIDGIKAGYATREATWASKRAQARESAQTALERAAARDDAPAATSDAIPAAPGGTAGAGPSVAAGAAALVLDELRPRASWRWIEWLDRIQKELTILSAGPAVVLGSIGLVLYAPFRAIPIKAIQDAAILRSADNFLTDWFGDLPDLLDDPVQSANVRARLGETIDGLRALACGRIVVVAHSGGAIVSFTTLLDPAFLDRPVHKLITLGEGLQLAWRLENAAKGLPPGSRLSGDLETARPGMAWVDYWGTYDPAPGGYLDPPDGAHARIAVDSRPVTNRMSIADDHGGYWDNDEGFVISLLRELDTVSGCDQSRFYEDQGLRAVRIERRRRRVAVLALWRWIAALGAVVPIVLATITGLVAVPGRPGPDRLGRDAAVFWSGVPGRDVLSGPLDWIASWVSWPAFLQPLGEWAVGSALIVVLFYALGSFGARRWNKWDLRERVAARALVLSPLDRRGPLAEFLLLAVLAALLSILVLAWLWRA